MAYAEREHTVQSVKRPGSLTLEGRRKLTVSGVEEVESFDENEITMRTGEGDLVIRGEGMHIDRLSVDNGDVNVLGCISELRYAEHVQARSFWARLWR